MKIIVIRPFNLFAGCLVLVASVFAFLDRDFVMFNFDLAVGIINLYIGLQRDRRRNKR